MTVTLYTLPSCGICKMVKTKLQQKNIDFVENNFKNIAEAIHSNRAPALEINNNGEITIYNTPIEIVKWIDDYGA